MVGLTALFGATVAMAQTTVGDAGAGTTGLQAGGVENGQTFTVPAGVSTLNDVKVAVSSSCPCTVSLHRRTAGVNGPALASTTIATNAMTFPNYALYGPTLPVGGIAVTPGETLAIVTDGRVAATLDYYVGGVILAPDELSAFDAYFTATFDAPTSPASIPTLSEWAMILMGVLMAGGAAVYIQRRRIAA